MRGIFYQVPRFWRNWKFILPIRFFSDVIMRFTRESISPCSTINLGLSFTLESFRFFRHGQWVSIILFYSRAPSIYVRRPDVPYSRSKKIWSTKDIWKICWNSVAVYNNDWLLSWYLCITWFISLKHLSIVRHVCI